MKPAIMLQTKSGYEFYCDMFKEVCSAKAKGTIDVLKERMFSDRGETEQDILTFLNDPIMMKKYKMDDEDVNGWQIYKELSDKFSTLNYFYTRQ